MIKKLIKHGNSTAVILDKSLLKLLNIDNNTNVKIKTDGKRIIIEPVIIKSEKAKDSISEDKKMQQIYNKLVKKYGPALKKLADN